MWSKVTQKVVGKCVLQKDTNNENATNEMECHGL